MLRLIPPLFPFVSGALACAQAQPQWRFDAVTDCPVTVVVVAWQHGLADDADGEHGLARVLAECRLLRAKCAAPDVSDTGVLALADVVLTFGALPAGSPQVVPFARALFEDAPALSDDAIATLVARAALAADDAAWLYPGQVLDSRARALVFPGQPAGRPAFGSAAALQSCTPAVVRERLRAPTWAEGHVFGAPVVGDLPALPAVPSPPPTAAVAATFVGRDLTCQVHGRVDGAYVACAVPVPQFAARGTDGWRDWVVGMEVARVRAARELRLRGDEALAHAPVVGWTWRGGEDVAVFTRRGHDGDPPDVAQRELHGFLDGLCQRPPSARELTSAIHGLCAETAMPPWSDELQTALRRSSGALVGRAVSAALARQRGLDRLDFTAATAAGVHAALRAGLAEGGALWLGLVPVDGGVRATR